jgi:hypothetical protein
MNNPIVDFNPESEILNQGTSEASGEASTEQEVGVPSEADEIELAASLLEVTHESRLDRFLATLARSVGVLDAARAKELGGLLKGVATQALPRLARGGLVSNLGSGREARRQSTTAGEIFGLELEGLSNEDQEFEAAKAFVRLAAAAAHALATQTGNASPASDARRALRTAAERHAAGLLGDVLDAATRDDGDPSSSRAGENARRTSLTADPSRVVWRGSAPHSKEIIMHDIDRTSLEYGQQESAFESGQFGEYEQGEFGQQEFGEYEYGQGEWSGEYESEALGEAEQVELAAELLGVSNEAELEQFLGSLISKVGKFAGQAIRSPIGQALIPVLKSAAGKALPMAGAALGGYFGGPLGAKIGTGVANAAGQALGLEAESLSNEDREFEGAKQFVKLAAETVKNAASAGPGSDPRAAAQQAVIAAAKKLAPALLGPGKPGNGTNGHSSAGHGGPQMAGTGGRQPSGRWVRNGKVIVLLGV